METTLIIFFASFSATLLSVMSGGGASVISLPIFLWAGVPLPTALSTHKICAMFWTPVSAWNYLRKGRIEWGFLLIFAVIGLAGAFFGVQLVVHIDQRVLEPIVGGFILLLVVYTWMHKDLGLHYRSAPKAAIPWFTYPAALVMGFYESILGSGNGIVFTALTCRLRGFDFLSALGHYFAVAFLWVAFSSFLYIERGFFDLSVAIAAVLGSLLGGYSGSRYAKYRGNRFVKSIFIVVGLVLGIKMLAGV
ncbi:MAG: sulfite exporter TauE/SafE family protein [Spirochaetia bacterium]